MSVVSVYKANLFQGNSLIVAQVNFKIKKGEIVYLIGKSGTGKSTILKVLNCDIPLLEGTIIVAGYNVREISKRNILEYRKKVATIFYDPIEYIPKITLYESLVQLLKSEGHNNNQIIEQSISNALLQVGLNSKKSKLLREMSFGERLLSKIARVLLVPPAVLLIDAVLEHLDPESSDELMSVLINISMKHEIPVLIATNDYPMISKWPQRTFTIETGRMYDSQYMDAKIKKKTEPKNITYVFPQKRKNSKS